MNGITALRAFGVLLTCIGIAHGQAKVQVFSLDNATDLTPAKAKAEAVEYKGRKAVRLTMGMAAGMRAAADGVAMLPGTDFQDGTIEADIALKIALPPGVQPNFKPPGFVGLAFRARPDASRYELFYLRPGNSSSDDQGHRNHSVQYTSEPDYPWPKLRRAWPWIYEAHADLALETWTKVKIEVKGRSARLYVNGSVSPSLVVDGLKGQDLKGGVGLWTFPGQEAYFSNVRITHATPLTVKNGSDAAGAWQVAIASDMGPFQGTLQLERDGGKLTGTWSGGLGSARPVSGTWRDGYVELTFQAQWPAGRPDNAGEALARLAGWIDGDRVSGRLAVDGRTDGIWTGTRKP